MILRGAGDAVDGEKLIAIGKKNSIAKIDEIERVKAVEEAIKLLEPIPQAPKGTAEALVRKDRDSN